MRSVALALVLCALMAGVSSVDLNRRAKHAQKLALKAEKAWLKNGGEAAIQAALQARAMEHVKWCSGEHMDIGQNAWDLLKTSFPTVFGDPLRQITGGPTGANAAGGLNIRFDEMIALAGDFFGPDPDDEDAWNKAVGLCNGGASWDPASRDCQARATAALDTLLRSTGTQALREVPVIIDLINRREMPTVHAPNQRPTQSLAAYRREDRGRRTSIDFSRVTRATDNGLLPRDPPNAADQVRDLVAQSGRYMKLATMNRDHFRENDVSMKAYKVFHHKAIQKMLSARSVAAGPAQTQAMNLGLVYEAWALHYLTDSFSAGHMRTPRALLVALCDGHTSTGGVVSACMHDEDSRFGLLVRARGEPQGETWRAFGDSSWSDPRNSVNRAKAIEAARTSLNEVAIAFRDGTATLHNNFLAIAKFPEVVDGNFPPLYKAGGPRNNDLMRRRSDPDAALVRYEQIPVCSNQAPIPILPGIPLVGRVMDVCADYVADESDRMQREYAAGRYWPSFLRPNP